MRRIRPEDINKLNDTIMELPAFAELNSKELIHDLLNYFMEDLYTKQPKEIFDAMEFNSSARLQETFFANYGIDKNYSNKLKGYLKKDIAFQLEALYQNKGSNTLFRMFADIFATIFRRINFYNIKVYKIPRGTSFRYEYRLVPLYITDKDSIIEEPQIPVEQNRKYLMELENYKNYKVWPVPTNLVYIQFSIGEEIINNEKTFLDGVRAFGTTYLFNKTMPYSNRYGFAENISLDDVEIITNYFKVEITKRASPDWEFNTPMNFSTYLPYSSDTVANTEEYPEHAQWTTSRIDFMQNIQQLMLDYSNASRKSRPEMEAIKRRWQMFLKLKETSDSSFSTYDSINDFIKNKYPLIHADFNHYLDLVDSNPDNDEPLFDFYIYFYSIFLNGVLLNQEDPSLGLDNRLVLDYIDVLFGNLFIEANFLKWYFNPVMDLFIRYFFPVEMDYINDLIPKVFIRDKFNAISYDDNRKFIVRARQLTKYGLTYGTDNLKFNFEISRHSRVEPLSLPRHNIIVPTISNVQLADTNTSTIF
jgi:hypothetical protein